MIYVTEAIDDEQIAFLPSPDAIKAACEAIRATWGPGEEQRRRRWSIPPPVEVSEVGGVAEPVE